MVDRVGATDGRTIYLDPAQTQAERRCTLAHELVHVERGHVTGCHPRVERDVRIETARRLVAIDDLVRAYVWASSLDELAEELHVTPAVLTDRMERLAPAEAQAIADALHDRDG